MPKGGEGEKNVMAKDVIVKGEMWELHVYDENGDISHIVEELEDENDIVDNVVAELDSDTVRLELRKTSFYAKEDA